MAQTDGASIVHDSWFEALLYSIKIDLGMVRFCSQSLGSQNGTTSDDDGSIEVVDSPMNIALKIASTAVKFPLQTHLPFLIFSVLPPLSQPDLLRCHSTKSGDEMTSLKDYGTRMNEGRKDIYCITVESKNVVENKMFFDRLKKRSYEGFSWWMPLMNMRLTREGANAMGLNALFLVEHPVA